jgi:hypothetical protein
MYSTSKNHKNRGNIGLLLHLSQHGIILEQRNNNQWICSVDINRKDISWLLFWWVYSIAGDRAFSPLSWCEEKAVTGVKPPW